MGGGGGITSEGVPREDGNDDQYGFFDVAISKSAIKLEAISHSGIIRSTTIVAPRVEPSTTTVTTTATATSSTMTMSTTTYTNTTTTRTASFRARPDVRHYDNLDPVVTTTTSHLSLSHARFGYRGASVCRGALLLLLFIGLASHVPCF